MTNQKIALQVLEEHLRPYSQRSEQLASTMLEFIIKFEQNKNLHSKYIRPLHRFWDKVKKEDYIKEVSNSYQVGVYSKKYEYGKELIKLRNTILDKIMLNVQELEEKRPNGQDILFKTKDINKLTINMLTKKSYRHKDYIVIEDNPKQQQVYFDKVGRSYSIFSQLSKQDRKLSNTPHEIDLSTSVQNIYLNQYSMMNEITYNQVIKDFPCHSEYINNKVKIRNKLANEYIQSYKELETDSIDLVKTFLTKISFRGSSEKEIREKFRNPDFVLGLFHETKELTKPIITLINKIDDRTAIKKHITDNLKKKKEQTKAKRTKVGSKLFFYYEYQENKIREAMIDFTNDSTTKSVHDAIYTREEQDINKMKQHILNKTGFTVSL